MPTLMLVWAFLSFLYYKIAFAAFVSDYYSDYQGISIIAAFLIGIITAGSVFLATLVYISRFSKHFIEPGVTPVSWKEVLQFTFVSFLTCSSLHIIAVRLIILGFSRALDSNISVNRNGAFAWFLLIAALPMLVHYALISSSVVTGKTIPSRLQ